MWLIETMTTTAGDTIAYAYAQDGAQRYVSTIAWGRYQLAFVYETRPDQLSNGTFGFLLTTVQRCARIELHSLDTAPTLVRSWNFAYTQGEPAGLSLLSSITVRGHGADGSTLDAPPTTFGYTTVAKRTLTRVEGPLAGASPPPLDSGALELVDWDGDGLPDLFEMRAGEARVWRNRGRNRWGYPIPLPAVPGPVDLAQPGVAFADLLGSGTVDLIAFGSATSRYVPIQPGGGFGRLVQLDSAPPLSSTGLASRFVDLDGDGRTDVLTMSDDFFALYYRENGGYSQRPQTLPLTAVPAADLRDPHVKLADMTGDGLQDLVRVDGASVRYWPYLGYGRWADAIVMTNPPTLPRGYDPSRLFLVDVDGDGCADFVYVDDGSVTLWFNRGGTAVGPAQTISFTPSVSLDNVRLVDLNGAGTIGVLWSNVPYGASRSGYVFLDLCGGSKPYLLSTIDNGIGRTTTIAYRPSTEFAIDAAESGEPWATFHPFPVQCVAAMTVADAATNATATTRYAYGPARYDSAVKAFLGFAVVDTISAGDASVPGQRARNTYHLGVDPADVSRPLDGDEVLTFGALRRRLLKTEIFGLDGSAQEALPYRTVTHEYASRIEVAPNGARIGVGYETLTTETVFERAATPFSTHTIAYAVPGRLRQHPVTAHGGAAHGVATPDLDVTTTTTFAQNVGAHVVSLPARITQTTADGTVVSAKVTYYDGTAFTGLPEGQATLGQVSRVDVLAFTSAMVTSIFGASPPDLARLGYLQHPGEDGWWIGQVAYERQKTSTSFTFVRRNQLGFDAQLVYDATGTRPERMVDELGNVTTVTFDARAMQIASLTDASGGVTTDAFDLLGRVTATVSPGDTAALPSALFAYQLGAKPYALATSYRITLGQSPRRSTRSTTSTVAGNAFRASFRAKATPDAATSSATRSRATSAGSRRRLFEPFYADDPAYGSPPAGTPATTITYDGAGRLAVRRESSGAITALYVRAGAGNGRELARRRIHRADPRAAPRRDGPDHRDRTATLRPHDPRDVRLYAEQQDRCVDGRRRRHDGPALRPARAGSSATFIPRPARRSRSRMPRETSSRAATRSART